MPESCKIIENITKESEYLNNISLYRKGPQEALYNRPLRILTPTEQEELIRLGNRATDWTAIKVTEDFLPDEIRNNRFEGPCCLGRITGKTIGPQGYSRPSGLRGNTLSDVWVGDEVLVEGNGFVSRQIIASGSMVVCNREITAALGCRFGNGSLLCLGNEASFRELPAIAELTVPLAAQLCREMGNRGLHGRNLDALNQYTQAATLDYGVIRSGAVVKNNGTITSCYIETGALVDNNIALENCTILAAAEEKSLVCNGNILKNSLIQWGCEVEDQSIINASVLTEHSHSTRHAKITQSLIGPNTGIAEGEVTASLVGPFVGFHHQSLLIAAFWPEGKGNVAYGANVGSNHTSKAADQEIYAGEGLFFGLGCSVKFPSNFREAPYSIIASGVTTLPQKVELPFSLINTPSKVYPGVSPALNEIFPAWVLSDNIYLLFRNEGKYRDRNKAKRYSPEFRIFRQEILKKIIRGRDILQSPAKVQEFYTNLPGLGKNVVTEQSRLKGIAAYNFYIRYALLRSLCPWEDSPPIEEELYTREGIEKRLTKANLQELREMLKEISKDLFQSKEKDDLRGRNIIEDYDTIHIPAGEDSFVKRKTEEHSQFIAQIEQALESL